MRQFKVSGSKTDLNGVVFYYKSIFRTPSCAHFLLRRVICDWPLIDLSRVTSPYSKGFVSVMHQSAPEVVFVKMAALVSLIFHFGYVILAS